MAAAVAQIRTRKGVSGAGFLITDDLLVSCAHVLVAGGSGPGGRVELVFARAPGAPTVQGQVLEDGWRAPSEHDVALVRLDHVPPGTVPLRLGSAAGCQGHRLRSLGFPKQAPPGGHFGFATAGGTLPAADNAGDLLQLTDANDLTTGFSGGPLYDEATGLVVGMLTAIAVPDQRNRGQGIAYATPTAVLREAWPTLDVHDVLPYRALEPFTAEHARWFHGREEAKDRVMASLAGQRRAVLLLGPSGAGKSSLVQAGVLPSLAAGALPGSHRWRHVVARPGLNLAASLEQAGLTGASTAGIAAAVSGLLAADTAHDRVVLVIDQFEEVLAPGGGPRGVPALAQIAEAIRSDAMLTVILVMRDDFYSRLSALAPDLLQAVLQARGVINIPSMLSTEALDAIICKPAGDLKIGFEPGLAQQIITDILALHPDDAANFEAPVTVLPLLEFALARLWESRLEYDGRLTHAAYRRIGGVTGALTDWCESALHELDQREQIVAQRVLTALVRPADEKLRIPAAGQQLPLQELIELAAGDSAPESLATVEQVLHILTGHRIVVTDRARDEEHPHDTTGSPAAALIHDALIRDWSTLRMWVDQNTRFLDWLHRARSQYARWRTTRDPRDLPTGTLLAEGADWSGRSLPADLEAFLAAGRRHQQTAIRRSRRLNIILACALVLIMLASATAVWQRQAAVTAQQLSQSRWLASQSASLIRTDPDLAGLLAVAAYRTSPTEEAAATLSAAASLPLPRRLVHRSRVDSVALSPDGHTLATVDDFRTVHLWNVATGQERDSFGTDGTSLFELKFSPDGRTLALVGSNGTVELMKISPGGFDTHLLGVRATALSVAFSPDGRTLAVGDGDGEVHLWELASGKKIVTFSGDREAVHSLAFSTDGRTLATAGEDNTVRLWRAATGKAVATFANPTGTVPTVFGEHPSRLQSVAFSPDGRTLAAGASTPTVWLWDLKTGRLRTSFSGYTGAVLDVAFSRDGRTLATGGSDNTVRLWEVASGKLLTTLTGHTEAVNSVAFTPDGRTLITGSHDHTVRLWDVVTHGDRTILTSHIGSVLCVAFSPDGRTLATGGFDKTVRLWDVAAGKEVTTLTGHTDFVRSLAFSPDGRTLATGGEDSTTRLWDVKTAKERALLTGHRGAVGGVVFSPDGRTLATAGSDGTARLWDVASGRTLTVLDGQTTFMRSVAFSPDGRTLATVNASFFDTTVGLWDVATSKRRTVLSDHADSVNSVAYSPDGRVFATASSDGTVLLWDVATAKRLDTFTGHGDNNVMFSVAFSPDGRTLAAASDSTVLLWDTASGKELTVLTGHAEAVRALAFSPDGRTLATAGADHTVRLWAYTAPDAAITTICGIVARDLTPEERAIYLPGQPLEPICSPPLGPKR
ncbi:trypsin-like peptidase domain-containing protein [Streptomyces sp. NPDC056524]|uniref:nSTAND1 domain-containing NTPase n=1 Tax=Streptomyces sp. NPDC056524 TaxID=3345851 RepID=UPI00368781EF